MCIYIYINIYIAQDLLLRELVAGGLEPAVPGGLCFYVRFNCYVYSLSFYFFVLNHDFFFRGPPIGNQKRFSKRGFGVNLRTTCETCEVNSRIKCEWTTCVCRWCEECGELAHTVRNLTGRFANQMRIPPFTKPSPLMTHGPLPAPPRPAARTRPPEGPKRPPTTASRLFARTTGGT